MAKMSRAHFQLIAETLKSLTATDALKATNPAFNAHRFQDVATGKRAR
jgi:hypothetical protein